MAHAIHISNTANPKIKVMSKNILIVDDQPATRKLLTHYLGNFYQTVTAAGAAEAIEWMKKGNTPDLIITDILMPEMTGIDFLRELTSVLTHLPPVVMLSSVENSSEKLKCFTLGAKDYVVKPFNPEELRIRISNLLN